jgi:peptidyl-tRNA hydrolase
LTHYVIVRSDLSIGLLAAQVVHAAGESSPGNLDSGTNAVVLAVKSESALLVLERQFQKAGIQHVSIRDPDLGGDLMAIGLMPVVDRTPIKKIVSSLPLLGREKNVVAV